MYVSRPLGFVSQKFADSQIIDIDSKKTEPLDAPLRHKGFPCLLQSENPQMPRRLPPGGGDLCAIFIHAGAGYHSHQNERVHLSAVNDAAKVAMAILKNGGSATDAVEMAIRLLEDKEITNAGYGSNLTMDGQVECDATLVDYIGRSGAVGAIRQVKNPIAVARLVLDDTTQPLSLQRVPPNLLVGTGATDYAADKGVPILPPDFLISASARERWYRWRQDLYAQQSGPTNINQVQAPRINTWISASSLAMHQDPHRTTSDPPALGSRTSLARLPALTRPLFASAADVPTLSSGSEVAVSQSSSDVIMTTPSFIGADYVLRQGLANGGSLEEQDEDATDDTLPMVANAAKRQKMSGSFDGSHEEHKEDKYSGFESNRDGPANDDREDNITDTVGAIAVDCLGRIAAGSSSGGIGMKHKGRCGPAALVGIGTAVVPADPQDPLETCVATVTSGTGEHMATTSAAATAADRIYASVRKENGRLVACNEDEAMHSVIQNDFMKHPGVSNSPCVGAIGILAVKKSRSGIYFYFGHNTDSFALASMHSEERKPVCTMSRSKVHGGIAQGGRVSRARHARPTQ